MVLDTDGIDADGIGRGWYWTWRVVERGGSLDVVGGWTRLDVDE